MIRYLHGVAYAIFPAMVPTPKPKREPTAVEVAWLHAESAAKLQFVAQLEQVQAEAKLIAAEFVAEQHDQIYLAMKKGESICSNVEMTVTGN